MCTQISPKTKTTFIYFTNNDKVIISKAYESDRYIQIENSQYKTYKKHIKQTIENHSEKMQENMNNANRLGTHCLTVYSHDKQSKISSYFSLNIDDITNQLFNRIERKLQLQDDTVIGLFLSCENNTTDKLYLKTENPDKYNPNDKIMIDNTFIAQITKEKYIKTIKTFVLSYVRKYIIDLETNCKCDNIDIEIINLQPHKNHTNTIFKTKNDIKNEKQEWRTI